MKMMMMKMLSNDGGTGPKNECRQGTEVMYYVC